MIRCMVKRTTGGIDPREHVLVGTWTGIYGNTHLVYAGAEMFDDASELLAWIGRQQHAVIVATNPDDVFGGRVTYRAHVPTYDYYLEVYDGYRE